MYQENRDYSYPRYSDRCFIAGEKQTKSRALVIVFEKDDNITIVTLFPTSKINKILKNRVRSGR